MYKLTPEEESPAQLGGADATRLDSADPIRRRRTDRSNGGAVSAAHRGRPARAPAGREPGRARSGTAGSTAHRGRLRLVRRYGIDTSDPMTHGLVTSTPAARRGPTTRCSCRRPAGPARYARRRRDQTTRHRRDRPVPLPAYTIVGIGEVGGEPAGSTSCSSRRSSPIRRSWLVTTPGPVTAAQVAIARARSASTSHHASCHCTRRPTALDRRTTHGRRLLAVRHRHADRRPWPARSRTARRTGVRRRRPPPAARTRTRRDQPAVRRPRCAGSCSPTASSAASRRPSSACSSGSRRRRRPAVPGGSPGAPAVRRVPDLPACDRSRVVGLALLTGLLGALVPGVHGRTPGRRRGAHRPPRRGPVPRRSGWFSAWSASLSAPSSRSSAPTSTTSNIVLAGLVIGEFGIVLCTPTIIGASRGSAASCRSRPDRAARHGPTPCGRRTGDLRGHGRRRRQRRADRLSRRKLDHRAAVSRRSRSDRSRSVSSDDPDDDVGAHKSAAIDATLARLLPGTTIRRHHDRGQRKHRSIPSLPDALTCPYSDVAGADSARRPAEGLGGSPVLSGELRVSISRMSPIVTDDPAVLTAALGLHGGASRRRARSAARGQVRGQRPAAISTGTVHAHRVRPESADGSTGLAVPLTVPAIAIPSPASRPRSRMSPATAARRPPRHRAVRRVGNAVVAADDRPDRTRSRPPRQPGSSRTRTSRPARATTTGRSRSSWRSRPRSSRSVPPRSRPVSPPSTAVATCGRSARSAPRPGSAGCSRCRSPA